MAETGEMNEKEIILISNIDRINNQVKDLLPDDPIQDCIQWSDTIIEYLMEEDDHSWFSSLQRCTSDYKDFTHTWLEVSVDGKEEETVYIWDGSNQYLSSSFTKKDNVHIAGFHRDEKQGVTRVNVLSLDD